MKWFKFYGQDWLTDLKIRKLRMEDRLCFITLLCLANAEDKGGDVYNCDEETLITLSGIPDDIYEDNYLNPFDRAKGCLKRFVDNKMITHDNIDNKITVINFTKRQGENLSGYERVKRYREKKRSIEAVEIDNDDNVHDNANDNARIDKIREDKNIENKGVDLPEWLDKKSWEDWVQHRKEIKKKLTPLSVKKTIKMLEENKSDHVAIINQSIEKGWQGLFPIKKQQSNVLQPKSDKYKGL